MFEDLSLNRFLMYKLAVNENVIDDTLEIEKIWSETDKLYREFIDSKFHNSIIAIESDMLEFLKYKSHIKEQNEGYREVLIMATKEYSKYVEINLKVPNKITEPNEVNEYITTTLASNSKLENAFNGESLKLNDFNIIYQEL